MTEDSTFSFFPPPWVSALITGLLLALPHLYKCHPQSSLLLENMVSLKKERGKKKDIVLIVSGQDGILQVSPQLLLLFFSSLFQTRHVGCHYSCSLSHFSNSPWHRHFDIQYFNCCRVIHLAVPSQQGLTVRQ